jgi:tRNA threonylcarbamoyladenosine biosynthesis protein TsaB
MPLTLAVEASGPRCSVALGDGRFLLERPLDRPREHHALVLPLAAELLSEAGKRPSDLDVIAFGRGPGSFTGVRIAVAFAQGLGFALSRPLLPVCSLHAIAQDAHRRAGASGTHVAVAVDAHMGEIYCALFARAGEGLARVPAPELQQSAGFSLPAVCESRSLLLAGDAWVQYPAIRPDAARLLAEAGPEAACILALAQQAGEQAWIDARHAEPSYVRGVSAWKTREAQAASRG